jgi:thiol:disulfide interchange protein DsbC
MRVSAGFSKRALLAVTLWVCGFLMILSILSLTTSCEVIDRKETSCLSKEEAASLLRRIFGKRHFAVLRVGESPIGGLWEVILETESGASMLYVDQAKQYFLGGPILTIHGLKNMTKEALLLFGEPKPDACVIPLEDSLLLGDPKATKRVIVFMNPECSACGEMLEVMEEISFHREDIVFYLKMLPGSPDDDSCWKAETIVSQKSLELLQASLAGESIPRPERPVPQVAENQSIADRLGVTATPSFVLEDGTVVEGILSRDTLLRWIEDRGRR